MTAWTVTTIAVLIALALSSSVCLWGEPMQRFVGLQLTNVLVTLVLLLLAQINDHTFFFDLAVAQSLLSFGAGLVFVRFLERWL